MIPLPGLERTRKLLRAMAGLRLVVLGDLMLDRFLWGTVSRISPEAPVPVVRLDRESTVLGGAGNVARNLRALGAEVDLVGVVGRDPGAEEVRRCLAEAGITPDGLVEVPGRATTLKSRVLAHHQQVVRIDRESGETLPVGVEEALGRIVLERLEGARGLVVSDYDKGVISGQLLEKTLPSLKDVGLPVAVDPKPANYEHYRGATVVTPNVQEARLMAGLRSARGEDLLEAGEIIRAHLGCRAIVMTEGERGMTLFQESSRPLRIPGIAREVFDVTGAGDTVVSTLTLALAASASLEEATVLANLAAGCVVGKLGTAVVTPEEILAALQAATEGGGMR